MEGYFDIIIVGGGASGFFTAIQITEQNPNLSICILEQSKKVLEKVKISGGGRCNVTNICSDPKELVKNYPRGNKNLLNIFYAFNISSIFFIYFSLNKTLFLKRRDNRSHRGWCKFYFIANLT